MGNIEQADGTSKRHPRWHRFIKKMKARLERRKAKKNPQCRPGYKKYDGYET